MIDRIIHDCENKEPSLTDYYIMFPLTKFYTHDNDPLRYIGFDRKDGRVYMRALVFTKNEGVVAMFVPVDEVVSLSEWSDKDLTRINEHPEYIEAFTTSNGFMELIE